MYRSKKTGLLGIRIMFQSGIYKYVSMSYSYTNPTKPVVPVSNRHHYLIKK